MIRALIRLEPDLGQAKAVVEIVAVKALGFNSLQ
jgi:hypothetical protein